MKKLQITMIAMLCVIIVFLCGILAVGMNRKSYYGCHGHMGKYSLVQEAEFSDVESLYAEYGKNPEDIYFYEGTSDKVVIKEYMNFEPKEGELSSFQQNGGELFLRGSKWNSDFSISFRNAYIEIYLPAGSFTDISAKTVSGDITAECDFKAEGNFSVVAISGDIRIQEVEAGSIYATSTSGDISFNRAAGDISIETTSGDVTLERAEGNVHASTTSGDIRIAGGEGDRSVIALSGDIMLTLPSEPGFNLEFDSESGVCDTFFDEQLSFNKKRTHAEGSCGNGGDAKVRVSTTSGDLRIWEY